MHGVQERWAPIADQDDEASRSTRSAATRFLSDLLQSPNLTVLAGLGTSLSLPGAPTMSDLWFAAAELADFDAVSAEVGDTQGDVELLLSRCEMLASIKPESAAAAFKREAEQLIFSRCRFVNNTTEVTTHQNFLRRVARRSTRLQRTQLFTTNYDIAFEVAAASLGYLIIDGFSYTTPRTFDAGYFDYDFVRRRVGVPTSDYVPEVFALHKLHGSVNWDSSGTRVIQVDLPTHPVLIFPRQSKYELSYELPFLESMARFQASLRQPNIGVLVIGFGFRDKHLVEPILGCLRANPTARIAVVDIALKASTVEGYGTVRRIGEQGDPRLVLINGSFQDFVSLLPDLAQRSESERQEQLIRDLLADRSESLRESADE
jgi:hypothetical protein